MDAWSEGGGWGWGGVDRPTSQLADHPRLCTGFFGVAGATLYGGAPWMADNLHNIVETAPTAAKFAVAYVISYQWFGSARHMYWDLTAKGFENKMMLQGAYAMFGAHHFGLKAFGGDPQCTWRAIQLAATISPFPQSFAHRPPSPAPFPLQASPRYSAWRWPCIPCHQVRTRSRRRIKRRQRSGGGARRWSGSGAAVERQWSGS